MKAGIREPIAIVGTACLFPHADDVETFWKRLLAGEDSVSESCDELSSTLVCQGKGKPDHVYSAAGAWREDSVLRMTDFDLPEAFLNRLGRPFRWTMAASREALRDANVWPGRNVNRARCGLVLGGYSWSATPESLSLLTPLYVKAMQDGLHAEPALRGLELLADGEMRAPIATENAFMMGMVAGLTARALSLSGPHYAIDAACASALYCLKLAAFHLWQGQADVMLAGGCSAFHRSFGLLGFATLQALADGARSRPLDAESDGLSLGEGAAAFVLKRLSDARRDGDRIHAIIRGVGLSNDGRGRHLLAPAAMGQQLAYERAYVEAGLPLGEVDYVECHATGTELGDKTELESLRTLFQGRNSPLLGSVKSNVGHLLAAAGFASALKVIGGLRSGMIPPTIGIRQPLCLADGFGGEAIVREKIAWPPSGQPRRGSVNAFGFGGANAHLILEQAPEMCGTPAERAAPPLESMAIIGMDGIFGGDEGLTALQRRAFSGRPMVRDLPAGRWRGLEPIAPAGVQGAFIEAFDIDPVRYRLPPESLERLNPSQVLMLRVADGAIRDAGMSPGGRVAVLIAMAADPSAHRLQMRWDTPELLERVLSKSGKKLPSGVQATLAQILRDGVHEASQGADFPGYIGNILASRVAALWDFTGPALTLSAEENSVFRCLELAQLFLSEGEADAVVVGAVDLAGSAENVLLRQLQTGTEPRMVNFGAGTGAPGWTIGEGAGAIVLVSSAAAKAEARRVRATIAGICVESGAEGPSSEESRWEASLEGASRAALKAAHIHPAEVGCVEMNASGLPSQDSAEARVLARLFGSGTTWDIAMGSAKALWGHCYGAAGMLALLRAAIALQSRSILPAKGRMEPIPEADNSRFYIPACARPWFIPSGKTRTIAVTSLAHDDSAACAILTESPESKVEIPWAALAIDPLQIIAVPMADHATLRNRLSALVGRVRSADDLAEVSAESLETLFTDETQVLCLAARSGEDLRREIQSFERYLGAEERSGDWRTPSGSCLINQPLGRTGDVAFVFPAIDSPYPGMMPDLFQMFPDAAERVTARYRDPSSAFAEELLYPRSPFPLRPEDWEETEARFRRTPGAMLRAGIAYSMILTEGLRESLGLEPKHAFGYSLGEPSMLFALGAWTADDEVAERLDASMIFTAYLGGEHRCASEHLSFEKHAPLSWSAYVLLTTPERAQAATAGRGDVYVSHVSTPNEVVICGLTEACREIVASLACEAFRTDLDAALHCPPAARFAEPLRKILELPVSQPNVCCHFSHGPSPDCWAPETVASLVERGLTTRLDFPALIGRVSAAGARLFIEVGAGNACTRRIKATLGDRAGAAIAFDQQRGSPARDSVAKLCAWLISHRVPIDLHRWRARLPRKEARNVRLHTVSLCGPDIAKSIAERLEACAHDFAAPPAPPAPGVFEEMDLRARSDVHSSNQSRLAVIAQSFRWRREAHRSMIAAQMAFRQQTSDRPAQAEVAPDFTAADATSPSQALYNEAAVMEFTEGKVSRVFGKAYEAIDSLPRRVRLPSPPFLALSRVTGLRAEPFQFEPCWIETEYDIPNPSWHEVDGTVPYLAADAQGVLFLLGYLGIDQFNRGERVYRWLDAEMRFAGNPLRAGQTVKYRIDIRSFVRHNDTLLFFTDFSCQAGGMPFLEIKNCCAGFFTEEELRQGQGISSRQAGQTPRGAIELPVGPRCGKQSFNEEDLSFLQARLGARCLGHDFANVLENNPALRLPPGPMRMIDRIRFVAAPSTDGVGGEVIAEKDLHPGDWYLRTHFKDSPVFAGPCMMEGCFQILQFYALYLALAHGHSGLRFLPHGGAETKVRFRSQVPAETSNFTTHMRVVELRLTPSPSIRADFDLIHHGVTVGRVENLGIRLAQL